MSLEKAEQYLKDKGMLDRVVRLSVDELEQIAGAKGWVDVCKEA